ncbi:ribonuclease P protein subunit p38 [Pelobates fuscus]|uniref:ribonuclease P protein subunit p38 n=1 Tax=Pelobates fuscus TaxID=191477 RepID=UPI002FE454DF
MAAKVAKGSVRKSKSIVSKTSLNSPFQKAWNTVVGDDMQFIHQTLLNKIEALGLKKIEPPNRPKKRKGAKKKQGESADEKDTEPNPAEKSCEKDSTHQDDNVLNSGWTHAEIRKQLAIGINEVTRAVEKNELILILVCKSAKPVLITKHLIDLSASRKVPACQLPRLSENIGAALGLKSLLALGFRKDCVFLKEVKSIIPRVPPLDVPWLQSGSTEEAPATDTAPEEDITQEEEKGEEKEKPKAGLKRKMKTEQEESSSVVFQGLKVKKIVPNPNKIRKVKKAAKKK